MNEQMIYGAILSMISAIFWYWVRGIDARQNETKQLLTRLEERLHEEVRMVSKEYQRREDAHRDQQQLMLIMQEVKSQLNKINDKLDRKADK